MFADKPVIIHRVSRVTSFVLIITSLNALAAGYSFIVDPDGSGLGITMDYLQHSPFRSFLIPGIVLMTCIGIVSIIAATALFCKKLRVGSGDHRSIPAGGMDHHSIHHAQGN